MDKKDKELARKKLDHIETLYKFVLGISGTCISDKLKISYYDVFVFGKHSTEKGELKLSKNEEKVASQILEHIATYTMMVQLNKIMEIKYPNRLQHSDINIRNASQIIRLIRNAFAHDPLEPVWQITQSCDNQIFQVGNIIKLDTTGLNGKKLKRMDYGGPLALLRLLQYVRDNLLVE